MSVWAFGGNRFDISRNSSLKAFPASSGCSSILAEKWNLCELTEREEFVWLRVWSKENSSPNGARVNFAKLLLKFWSFFPRWSHLPPFYGRWVSLQKYWYFLAGVHVRIYLVNCLSLLWEGIRINKRFHVISTWNTGGVFVGNQFIWPSPIDIGRELNVHKTFRRRLGHFLNVLCTFNLRPVSTGPTEFVMIFNIS